MLVINHQDCIGDSMTRLCYLDPRDPGRVIKIMRNKPVSRRYDSNWQEWQHYQYILKRHGHLDFTTVCHGFVETSLGPGLVFDCIRDHDGQVSSRLHKALTQPEKYDLQAVGAVLKRICRIIVEKNVQLFDMNLFNILIQIRDDGSYHPYVVDIKGRYNNYEWIPVSTYLPFFSRRKLRRRCGRLLASLQQQGH
jgi:hypothetical protein